jgi:deoxyribodipyrimidine photo-lyase
MTTVAITIFWFRQDLRLHDQLALKFALDKLAQKMDDGQEDSSRSHHLLPVVCLPDFLQMSPWGFSRMSSLRRYWLLSALRDLSEQLEKLGCPLLICPLDASSALPQLARHVGTQDIVCEEIAAPEEQAEVLALRAAGLKVHTVWQSSLLMPDDLPWDKHDLPAVFTTFRQRIEGQGIIPPLPLPSPSSLPSWPAVRIPAHLQLDLNQLALQEPDSEPRSSFPLGVHRFSGGETAALAHLQQYLSAQLPHSYKQTRNALMGIDFSSKWSPWLANGALSARHAYAELKQFEQEHGANDGSYWLWFELLWRDYFRFLHLQYGVTLYGAQGLSTTLSKNDSPHDQTKFEAWCEGTTGERLIDAAMCELKSTGYLSNRLRQVVASYLIYELDGDWRAGASWFESCLVDYDVYSNQGNWLYIAGKGTDPRGGRRFNVAKQVHDHDREGLYQLTWLG